MLIHTGIAPHMGQQNQRGGDYEPDEPVGAKLPVARFDISAHLARIPYQDFAYRDVGKGREQGRGSFAYRDVGKGREQGRGSFAYRDVGKGREQGRGSFAYRDVGKGREQGCGSFGIRCVCSGSGCVFALTAIAVAIGGGRASASLLTLSTYVLVGKIRAQGRCRRA